MGCSGKPTVPRATLTGTVKVDGQPVDAGTIQFVPGSAGNGAGVSAEIVAGNYTVANEPIGKVHVVIIALMSLVLSLLATIYPSLRAARVNPAEALRYE